MLKDKIRQAAAAALKIGEVKKVETLRFLVSLIEKKELALSLGQMKEEDEIAVLRKELKDKQEAREMFVRGGRDDLVVEVEKEIEILKEYLPAEMSDEEIEKMVREVVGAQSIAPVQFGMVMGETMKRVAGRAGGERVARIVKECLT